MKIKRFSQAVTFLGLVFLGGGFLLPAGAQDAPDDFDSPFGVINPFNAWDENKLLKEYEPGKTHKEVITETLRDLGVNWVSDSVFRGKVEILNHSYKQTFSSQPAYDQLVTLDFELYDLLIEAYEAANTKILFVINPKSDWEIIITANDKYKLTKNDEIEAPQTDLDFDYYKEYVTKLIEKYGDRIAGWFIFNEPADDYKISQDNYDINSYVKLVEITYPIIKAKNPRAIVILGGPSASSKLDFYDQVLAELKKKKNDSHGPCSQTGCFEVWDYHTYAVASEYKKIWTKREAWKTAPDAYSQYRNETYRYFEIYKDVLNYHGFNDKPLITAEGATYTGEDRDIEKPDNSGRTLLLQDEKDQAAFLVKRAVYLLSKGVKLINWSTVLENYNRNFFNYTGLIYNGDRNGQTPDSGYFERKLSFYAYKFLIGKLKDAKRDSFKKIGYYPISTKPDFSVSIYTFENKRGETKFVLWADYYDYDNQEKPPLRSTLLLPVTVSVNIPDLANKEIKITKAVPERKDGEIVFASSWESVGPGGNLGISLNKEPLYIELAEPNNPPEIIPPIGNKTIDEGQLLNFIVTAQDQDEDSLTYSASNLPPGASFNGQGTFLWTPDFNQSRAEDYPVIFSVSDGRDSVSETIAITVKDVIDTITLRTLVRKNRGKMTIKLYAHSSLEPGANLTYKLKVGNNLIRQGALFFKPKPRQNYYYALIRGLAIASYKIEVSSDKGGKAEILVNP